MSLEEKNKPETTPVALAALTPEQVRFAELEAKGWHNLGVDERKEYIRIKPRRGSVVTLPEEQQEKSAQWVHTLGTRTALTPGEASRLAELEATDWFSLTSAEQEELVDLKPSPPRRKGPRTAPDGIVAREQRQVRKLLYDRRKQAERNAALREVEGRVKQERFGRVEGRTIEMTVGPKQIQSVYKNIWQIRNTNVASQCIENGAERAHELGVSPTLPFWKDGVDDPFATDELGGRSEVLTGRDLCALYYATCKGLPVMGQFVDSQQWLTLRDRARKDLWWLAVDVLAIPLVESVHRELTEEFFPKLDCDGMFTKDGYSIVQMQEAIARQSPVNEFMNLDARGYMKTALASAFVLQFMLNFPDCRIFDVSGTDDLALGFLRIMKGYLSHENGGPMSTRHLLFPEYTLRGVDATSEEAVLLPCRRFFQKDFSFETFGIMSAASGRHADLMIGDDIVQERGTEPTREKLKNKADSLSSNVPDTHALRIWLGTRYDENDYYSNKIRLWEEDPTSMKFMCHGVFTPKQGFESISVQDLTLDQVDLRWPNKAGTPEKTWKDLDRKRKVNLVDFCFQQLNSVIPFDDSDNKIAFDMDKFPSLFIDPQSFPKQGDQFMVVDVAWSTDKRADFSVILVGRIAKPMTSSSESVYIDYIDCQRRRSSELAVAIVETSSKYFLKSIIVEKIGGVEAVLDEVRRQATLRGHTLPYIYPAPVILTSAAKWSRIKNVELIISQSRFWFSNKISQTAIALTLDQFGKYTGKRSSTRHDDLPDACALLLEWCLPKEDASGKEKQKLDEAQALAYEERVRQQEYDRIFGGSSRGPVDWRNNPLVTTAPDSGRDVGVTRGTFGIPGLRGSSTAPQDPTKKRISFSDTQPKR